jgi:Protein of unknown function (DUF3043)
VFRRSKNDTPEPPPKPGGKGRPTPTRKEAEAAAKARAKAPRSRKEQAAAQRSARLESGAKTRQAMRTGDDRYLPARDKGPVRRFIRDFVDSRISIMELLLPVLVVSLVLGYSGSARLVVFGNALVMGALLLVLVDMLILRIRLHRQLARRFPDEPVKGTTFYAIMRAMQLKFLRMPKAMVKLGQELPEHYR